jgi:hypothetical protein
MFLSISLENPYWHTGTLCLINRHFVSRKAIFAEVESELQMELVLNLAWALSAVVIIGFWLRFAPKFRDDWRTQLVALAVLILILFPVISVTDDLQAIQNPAETDSSLRRNETGPIQHAVSPAIAAPPVLAFVGISLEFRRLAAPGRFLAPTVDQPALSSIQNRPPPIA